MALGEIRAAGNTQAHGSFSVVRTGTQAGKGDSITIRVGNQIKGWTVTQIEPSRLFLSRDDRLALGDSADCLEEWQRQQHPT